MRLCSSCIHLRPVRPCNRNFHRISSFPECTGCQPRIGTRFLDRVWSGKFPDPRRTRRGSWRCRHIGVPTGCSFRLDSGTDSPSKCPRWRWRPWDNPLRPTRRGSPSRHRIRNASGHSSRPGLQISTYIEEAFILIKMRLVPELTLEKPFLFAVGKVGAIFLVTVIFTVRHAVA